MLRQSEALLFFHEAKTIQIMNSSSSIFGHRNGRSMSAISFSSGTNQKSIVNQFTAMRLFSN